MEIAVVAVFDISFTSYFLWAFVFVFLSTLVRNRWAKLALAVPAPLWGIRGAVRIFLVPALPFCRILTLSPVLGNLVLAGAALPFILVVLRLGLAFPGKGRAAPRDTRADPRRDPAGRGRRAGDPPPHVLSLLGLPPPSR